MTKRIIRLIVKTLNGVCIACLLFVGVSTLAPVAAQNSTATPTPAGSNLALGKSASQSSTLDGKQAGYAVDGNTDGATANNSVSSTQLNAQAWWQVDLGANYNLTDVRIWNRTDTGTESRLSNFYVLVSDVPFTSMDLTTARNQAGVSGYPVSGTAGRPGTVSVNRSGRYVRVQLVGTDFLNLAEVEVFATMQMPTSTATLTATPGPINLAVGKSASQSSNLGTGTIAGLAIDGNTDGNYSSGSVSHTKSEYQPWWQVDLGAVYSLTDVKIWNRTDCCTDRLSTFYILVSDVPFTSTDLNTAKNQSGVNNYYVGGSAGSPTTVNINRTGRYVRIQLSTTNSLHMAEVQVFTTTLTPTPTSTNTPTPTLTALPSGVNITSGKAVSQSSNLESTSTANLAIDGITNGNYSSGSVSHTKSEYQPWWQIDLGAIYTLTNIKIWNRTDCCTDRLSTFYVLVSDVPFTSTDLNLAKSQSGVSNFYISGSAGSPTTININRTGRYVRIQLSTTNSLHMAEVQVFSTGLAPAPTATMTSTRTPTITPTRTPPSLPAPYNIAAGKSASQSSTYGTASAGLAVDGNTDGVFNNGSVNHTNSDSQAWWQVDLGGVYTLTDVQVWNRTDCCGVRVSNFYILVSDNPFSSTDLNTARNQYGVTSYYVNDTAGTPTTVNVNRTGRYIRVQLTTTNYLNMAEVKVFSNGVKDVAIGKSAGQSSTYSTASAALAIDGNTDGNFNNGSVNHTNSDSQAWWQVDLGAVYDLTTINVWNRTDGSQSRLSGFYVLVSDIPFNSTDLNIAKNQSGVSYYYISGIAGSPSIVNANRSGRYVRVQLSATNYLHMAEVQVFSSGPVQ